MLAMFRRSPLLSPALSDWQFACFAWLLRHSGGIDALRRRRVVQPTPECFPQARGPGPETAEALFQQVRRHAGMQDWPCELEVRAPGGASAQDRAVPPPATGNVRSIDGRTVIAYDPAGLDDPMALVATFVHELARYRTAVFDEPPPDGWQVWEPATDLTAVFMGFGIFLANARSALVPVRDDEASDWAWHKRGYLTESELLHAHAAFCALLDVPARATLRHLQPSLRSVFRRAVRDVARRRVEIDSLGKTPGLRALRKPPVSLQWGASRLGAARDGRGDSRPA